MSRVAGTVVRGVLTPGIRPGLMPGVKGVDGVAIEEARDQDEPRPVIIQLITQHRRLVAL
eukprot:COSAG06_NODE_206_length_20263_cov_29.102559_9_plen_60_part_00